MQSTQNSPGHKAKCFRSPAIIAVVICMIMGLRERKKTFMNEKSLQVTEVNSREWNGDNVRHPFVDSPAEALGGWMSLTLALGKIRQRHSTPAVLSLWQRLHMCIYPN